MKIETVDIIKDLVENWQLPFSVTNVIGLGANKFKFDTYNTYYLSGQFDTQTNPFTIGINGNLYSVLDVVDNTSVTLLGLPVLTDGDYLLPAPNFYHGTVTQTNTELSQISDVFAKTPMVYMVRTFKETIYNRDQMKDRDSDVILYFLTQSDFNKWKTVDYDKFAVKPMRNLAYAFQDRLKNHPYIQRVDSFDITDSIKFARYQDQKGYDKALFNDTLSGVGISITLPIRKNYKCNC